MRTQDNEWHGIYELYFVWERKENRNEIINKRKTISECERIKKKRKGKCKKELLINIGRYNK